MSFIPGRATNEIKHERRALREELRRFLDALAAADLTGFPVVSAADRYETFGGTVNQLARQTVMPKLGRSDRLMVEGLLTLVDDLPRVRPQLVHTDLVGNNIRWRPNGRLAGVIDWDEARADDPALDACCLWELGRDLLKALFDDEKIRRAKAHAAALLIGTATAATKIGDAKTLAGVLKPLPQLATQL
jgi:aminoglycoside phosphotransferase (APT) family kinase protein